jgi:hypothetical protein
MGLGLSLLIKVIKLAFFPSPLNLFKLAYVRKVDVIVGLDRS